MNKMHNASAKWHLCFGGSKFTVRYLCLKVRQALQRRVAQSLLGTLLGPSRTGLLRTKLGVFHLPVCRFARTLQRIEGYAVRKRHLETRPLRFIKAG